ncbi:hypothetical protein BTO30_14200 [Domibacillus antri]|uniref:Uncharacterized protein n=1 Tax=Domibacillus antri TaxID=1714264 RepID=A0A1Q8Q2S3_9BACI|nr:hypothetical protein [Domibacillus antri]OLN21627.1 hypothetical protein BTO30_14200 [Domibacillus antri]
MNPIKGYEKLSDPQRKILLMVHRKHLSVMGSSEREKRSLGHIKKVKWNAQEQCVEVYYTDGEWWHYSAKGTWY